MNLNPNDINELIGNNSNFENKYSGLTSDIYSYQDILTKNLNENVNYDNCSTAIIRSVNNFNNMNLEMNKKINEELLKKNESMTKFLESDNKELRKEIKKLNKSLGYSDDSVKRCYTCRPRGKVRKHIIGLSICGNYIFHHDLNNRPVILITPIEHIVNIQDLTSDMLRNLFYAIDIFCGFWNIKDYQVSYNVGQWKSHEHFHMKIKIPDKIASKMRSDHFNKIELEKQYQLKNK